MTHRPTSPTRRAVPLKYLTLLTVQEAADYASVSTQTVRRWIRAGALRILRAGRQIRIDESDLLAYLRRHDQSRREQIVHAAVAPRRQQCGSSQISRVPAADDPWAPDLWLI